MATNTTFATLQEDVRNYLERGSATTDPVVYAQIPRLINLAERRMARELKVQGFISSVTQTMTAGQAVYSKPDRWRDTVSINVYDATSRSPVFPRSYEYIRAYAPVTAATGTPEFYADYDYEHWLFAPAPATAVSMEVLYYALPPLLDDTNQSNWLTDYAPEALLYATLMEAALFLKDDTRLATFQSMYDRAAGMLNGEDLAKIVDRSSMRKEA